MDLTWADVCGRRLRRHGLVVPLGSPAEAAAAMCGAHAQVPSAAEVSIALRLHGVTRADVQEALWGDHRLIRTFGPRGTVHLLPAAELALWCGALGAVPAPVQPDAGARLSPERIEELVLAIGAVLAGAELTVDELSGALADRVGAWAVDPVLPAFGTVWPRWRQTVAVAAHRGVLCFGPNRGRKTTYTNPRRWLPGFTPAPPAEALAWLLDRYLYAYGPATPAHLARWLAATPGWARRLFEAGDLTEVTVEGSRAWTTTGNVGSSGSGSRPGDLARGVLLLPHFDAFTVGSQPRELLFPGAARQRALSRSGQAGNFPVLLVDGVVAGVWQQKRTGSAVAITVEPLRPLTARRQRQLAEQADRMGEILRARPTLTIGTVDVGAHA